MRITDGCRILRRSLHFPCVRADIAEVPEAAGQLEVFSAPAVLLFYRGREYHRQAGFLDFARLEAKDGGTEGNRRDAERSAEVMEKIYSGGTILSIYDIIYFSICK